MRPAVQITDLAPAVAVTFVSSAIVGVAFGYFAAGGVIAGYERLTSSVSQAWDKRPWWMGGD